MKILKTLLATALVCAASWTFTYAAPGPDYNPDHVLELAAAQSDVCYAELCNQYQDGEATITEIEEGVYEVEYRASDGGVVVISILENF